MTIDATDAPERFDLRSLDIAEEKREELLRLFPEVRTEDGQIDFERLRLALGEMVDVGKERYGLTWPGKADCFKTIQAPSLGTLLPCPEESVNFDTTENLIIEGDNLEVLKLLQKSYLGRVKMIYIDPPYNTGNDFIYPDNFSESLRTYLQYTGQADAEGKKFGTNTDTDGRFHSKWLNMMYPRIYLARNLLRDDGVLFVSVDDHEVPRLRALLDEIFGEENAVAEFVWQAKKGGGSDNNAVVVDHEYVACYARNARSSPLGSLTLLGQPLDRADEHGAYRRGRELNKWGANSLRSDRPTMHFPIPGPGGVDVYPIRNDGKEGCRRWGRPKLMAAVERGDADFVPRGDGTYTVYEKVRNDDPRRKPFRTWLDSVGQTADGTKAVKALFDDDKVYDFAKPPALISQLIRMGAPDTGDGEPALIMDFFAGSGTTAQAVLDLNRGDGTNRKFILVQLPEPTGRDDYPTIAEVTKERVRRVIARMNDEGENGLSIDNEDAQDRGFQVFKLAESNFTVWDATAAQDAEALEQQLEMHIQHIREDRAADDILYELLLKSGFALTTPIETLTLAGKTVYSAVEGAFLICLDRDLTMDLIRAMAARQPERVVCLDEGFAGNDQLKANAVQIFKTKGITSFRTV